MSYSLSNFNILHYWDTRTSLTSYPHHISYMVGFSTFSTTEIDFMQRINCNLFLKKDVISDKGLLESLKNINPNFCYIHLNRVQENSTPTDVNITEIDDSIQVLSLESKSN